MHGKENMVLIINPALEVLRRGMKSIGMTQAELFEDYRTLGGRVKQPNTIGAWLRGQTDVPYIQMTLLYRAVNLRLLQKGKPPIEIPFRNGLVDDRPAATGTDGANNQASGDATTSFLERRKVA